MSEIVAINVPVEDVVVNRRTGEIGIQTSGRRTGSRIDPLGVLNLKAKRSDVKIYKGADGWDISEKKAGKGAKEVKTSEINHGNIPPTIQPLGVTCDHLEHSFVLSFAALRRLRFEGGEKDAAGRTLLAALGLVALAEQDARGYALRSRCDLVCDGRADLELVHPDGKPDPVTLDRKTARGLYAAAFETAKKAGFKLSADPLVLTPQEKLVEIVRKSQELALAGAGGEEDGADDDGTGSGD
jgi:CRISPR-associated protein Csb1